MPREINPPRPNSPELKRLQVPQPNSVRTVLRIAGTVIFATGLLCVIIAMMNFFSGFGSMASPRLFWLAFVGMPLMFIGSVMAMYGFMGAVVRFAAGEIAPVAADFANYVAEKTKGVVETVAKAAGKGFVEGMEAGRAEPSGQGKA